MAGSTIGGSTRVEEIQIASYSLGTGNKCIITDSRVLWIHKDGSVYQLLLQDIRKISASEKGIFRKSYMLHIYPKDGGPETTYFTDRKTRDEMAATARRTLLVVRQPSIAG